LRLRLPLALALAVLAGSVLGACQSTQSKSAELEAKNGGKLLNEQGLSIKQESSAVTVLGTAVITDQDRAAVVVDVRNDTAHSLANVPVLIDVKDAKGKSVFKNDTPGLDPTLTSIPSIEPGQEVAWVNDQVIPTGVPKTVKATVGETQETLPPPSPQITVGEAKLVHDPVSGTDTTGDIENTGAELLTNTYVYAVARQGNQIVAAGRGAIDKLKPDATKPQQYHIFMVGDPTGADVSVEAAPTAPAAAAGGPPGAAGAPAGTTAN
jgi:hypothetical protein